MPPLDRYAPGLAGLLHYKPADIPADLRAGLAVTAVALPVGIAYAELAGFRPEVGLYSKSCRSSPMRFSARRGN
jgi:MFS superfamily sulfate permease-like transporter